MEKQNQQKSKLSNEIIDEYKNAAHRLTDLRPNYSVPQNNSAQALSINTKSKNFRTLIIVAIIVLLVIAVITAGIIYYRNPDSANAVTAVDNTTPVIIDTDVDSDDAMAILYLLSNPKIKVLGLSISGTGFMLQNEGVPIAMQLAALGGKPNTPVSYGSYTPITPLEGFPDSWRNGALKFYKSAGLPSITTPPGSRSSDKLIIDLVKKSPKKVTILGLAPNTNIANALSDDPTIKNNIEKVVLSAGAFGIAGNMTNEKQTSELKLEQTASYKTLANLANKKNASEYNVALDAAATNSIIQSGVPVLFSPLNASQKAPVDINFVNKLKAGTQNAIVKFVIGDVGPLVGQGVPTFMWDPVAASLISDLSICTDLKKSGAAVDVSNSSNYGATIESQYGKTVNICMNMNPQSFFDNFNKVISSVK